MSAHLLLILAAFVVPCTEERAGDWSPVDQPDLAQQLAEAPTLEPEALAAPARGVTSWTFQLVPNPDGKTYDALQWYFKSYGRSTCTAGCWRRTASTTSSRPTGKRG